MTVSRQITDVFNGVATSTGILSPTIDLGTGDGTPTAVAAWNNSSIWGGDTGSGVTAYSGFRMATGGIDLSTRSLIGWQSASDSSQKENLDTFANGGIRIVFDDGTNWSAYAIFGGNIGGFISGAEGAFSNFQGLGANEQSNTPSWWLDRDVRTPYASSGTLDWSSVTHIEMHFKPSSSSRIQYIFGRFVTADLSYFTGTASTSLWADMRSGHTNGGGGYYVYPWHFRPAPRYSLSSFQTSETMQIGIQVGDGSTTTTVSQSNFSLSAWGSADDYDSSTAVPPNTVILVDTPRLFDVYQAAADNVSFTDFLYSSTSTIGFRVRGNTSGTATFTRGTMTNLEQIELGHGTYVDCIWQDCTVPVDITANTSMTGSTIRDSYGLEVTGAAGDYSAIVCDFSNNSVSDVKLGDGGAGTYTLTGLTHSGTMYVWNSNTSNAVTASLAVSLTVEKIDLWFNYDNEASGPFSEGETLTFGAGATAKLQKLVDNGTTGTMYCELLTGSTPADNDTISGGTSSATADVDQAGGANKSSLTISQAVTVSVTAANLIDGTRVRLYNQTQASEFDNDTVSGGSGYTINLTNGVDYDSGDAFVLLATYQSGGTAKRVFRNSFTLTTANVSIVDSQVDWDEPNVLAIDGSTVTECATDFVEVQVEITDADNTTNKSRVAAFLVDAITTADGIRNWVSLGGDPVIDYKSGSEADIDADVATVTVINVKAASKLLVTDTFVLGWSDGVNRADAVLGSSIVWIAPNEALEIQEIKDIKTRLDLNSDVPNTYRNDETSITNSNYTLTKTDNGNGTFTIQRS